MTYQYCQAAVILTKTNVYVSPCVWNYLEVPNDWVECHMALSKNASKPLIQMTWLIFYSYCMLTIASYCMLTKAIVIACTHTVIENYR